MVQTNVFIKKVMENQQETKFMIAGEMAIKYDTFTKRDQLPKIYDIDSTVDILRPFFSDVMNHKERMVGMFLSSSNNVLGVVVLSEGGIAMTTLDSRVVFQHALLLNAVNVIIIHNHPSGNLEPSNPDISMTKNLKESGDIMQIKLLDSIIITDSGYRSIMY